MTKRAKPIIDGQTHTYDWSYIKNLKDVYIIVSSFNTHLHKLEICIYEEWSAQIKN